ncbi:hypothetical protein VP01_81g4 [Puccinia sorghi]|uniref:Uncharacterized protein n=1 Tax=Puccinia sorghi TaxID=27349 RepID=A0A0L6UA32_9BASI|nr:hypothetical protein VP01_81g4 [Puccinia sorghi]
MEHLVQHVEHFQVQNVTSLILTVAVLDGTALVFPCWCSCLQEILGMQIIVDPITLFVANYNKGYHPKDSIADWDIISELVCSTIQHMVRTTF